MRTKRFKVKSLVIIFLLLLPILNQSSLLKLTLTTSPYIRENCWMLPSHHLCLSYQNKT